MRYNGSVTQLFISCGVDCERSYHSPNEYFGGEIDYNLEVVNIGIFIMRNIKQYIITFFRL